MHPHRPGAVPRGQRGHRGRRRVALPGRRWARLGVLREHPPQKALSGRGDQHRTVQLTPQSAERADQREIVRRLFREAQPRVDHDALGRDTAADGLVKRHPQLVDHLGDHIAVHRAGVHIGTLPAPVHHHIRHARRRHHRDHTAVRAAATDVVDQAGAGSHGLLRDAGPHGVHADHDALTGQSPDHRQYAAQLLVLVHPARAWPGRLAADVHQVRALGDQVEAALDPGRGVEPPAAVGEGVRRHVDHTHHGAPPPGGQAAHISPWSPLNAHTPTLGPRADAPSRAGSPAFDAR